MFYFYFLKKYLRPSGQRYFFRKCSFCLLLPYLELWHSAVSTMLLAKGCSVTIDEATNFKTTMDIRCVNS